MLNKYNLKAEETLFVDDLKENVLGAKKVGIKSFLYNNNLYKLKEWIEKNLEKLELTDKRNVLIEPKETEKDVQVLKTEIFEKEIKPLIK